MKELQEKIQAIINETQDEQLKKKLADVTSEAMRHFTEFVVELAIIKSLVEKLLGLVQGSSDVELKKAVMAMFLELRSKRNPPGAS